MKSPPASRKAIAALDPAARKAMKGGGNKRDKFLKGLYSSFPLLLMLDRM